MGTLAAWWATCRPISAHRPGRASGARGSRTPSDWCPLDRVRGPLVKPLLAIAISVGVALPAASWLRSGARASWAATSWRTAAGHQNLPLARRSFRHYDRPEGHETLLTVSSGSARKPTRAHRRDGRGLATARPAAACPRRETATPATLSVETTIPGRRRWRTVEVSTTNVGAVGSPSGARPRRSFSGPDADAQKDEAVLRACGPTRR